MKNIIIKKVLLIICVLLILGACSNNEDNMIIDGGKTNLYLEGYKEDIKSKQIIEFEYTSPEFYVLCEKKEDTLHIISDGGNAYERDGTYFKLDYECDDLSFLNVLQEIVDKNDIAKDNGHILETAGLPAGLGDTISVIYQSGEAIYKRSNRHLTISNDANKSIYDAFYKLAIDNGYDFDSDGSNVELYNDADEEYLQGVWKCEHFGKEYVVEFVNNKIKIYCDNQLTDECEYIIINGCIRKNELIEDGNKTNSQYDYKEFSEISCFRKLNDFTLTAYFMKESYSTENLLKQN